MDRREWSDRREWGEIGWSIGRLWNGIIGGLAGGVVFGVLLAAFGLMDSIAWAMGADSVLAVWIYHLLVSAAFGILMALVARPELDAAGRADGLAWGFALWLLVGTVAPRSWLGLPISFTDPDAVRSLLSHLAYATVAWNVIAGLNARPHLGESEMTRVAA